MKRQLLVFIVSALSVIASAQQKVAILETVDKAQNVGYGVKLLLRSSLTSAISNTPGYEGYDRVDMASIAGEQEFQRTGNVSDSQIKQLGVATGASYVLVAEAALYDDRNIIITAKILDVETFGIKSSTVLVSGITAEDMQQACRSLAERLLGTAQPNTGTPPTAQGSYATAGPSDAIYLADLPDGTKLFVAKEDEDKRMRYEAACKACEDRGEGWRLPSDKELDLMRANKAKLGGFSIWFLYQSNEEKRAYDFGIGSMRRVPGIAMCKVRCVCIVK